MLVRVLGPAADAGGRAEGAVGLDQLPRRDAADAFQTVDVLRVNAQQSALFLQQLDKKVDVVGMETPGRPQLLGQRHKGLGVDVEEGEVEDGFRIRNVVLA